MRSEAYAEVTGDTYSPREISTIAKHLESKSIDPFRMIRIGLKEIEDALRLAKVRHNRAIASSQNGSEKESQNSVNVRE